ncbi:hypothetical protein ACIBSW_40420 [Actinoplanes sp. NPDC049668]|uniref:hypothetical protein n=1 Tax=unclassified Actinoplanes TaxID=2626549 RepID=UPI0033A20021
MTIAGTLLTLAAAPLPASAETPTAGNPDVRAAAQRISQGRPLSGDLALIRSVPGLAEKVADPSRITVTESEGLLATGSAQPNAAEVCKYRWQDLSQGSTLGFTIYTWRHYVEWCYNGQSVTRWRTRLDQVTYNDGTVIVGALLVDIKTPTPGVTASSRYQRALQQCVATVGCWATYLPWSQINVTRTGGSSASWGGLI